MSLESRIARLEEDVPQQQIIEVEWADGSRHTIVPRDGESLLDLIVRMMDDPDCLESRTLFKATGIIAQPGHLAELIWCGLQGKADPNWRQSMDEVKLLYDAVQKEKEEEARRQTPDADGWIGSGPRGPQLRIVSPDEPPRKTTKTRRGTKGG